MLNYKDSAKLGLLRDLKELHVFNNRGRAKPVFEFKLGRCLFKKYFALTLSQLHTSVFKWAKLMSHHIYVQMSPNDEILYRTNIQ